MNKTYKGYELIKAISEGNIKSGSKIEVHNLSLADNLITTIEINSSGSLVWKTGEFDTSMLSNEYYYFKLVEDNNIDIEELWGNCVGDSNQGRDDFMFKNRAKINELVQAVKQLNKEIKSIKESNI